MTRHAAPDEGILSNDLLFSINPVNEGWRVWHVRRNDDGELRLHSAVFGKTQWPLRQKVRAECNPPPWARHGPADEIRRTAVGAPHKRCEGSGNGCGIYAVRHPNQCGEYLRGKYPQYFLEREILHRVIGRVSLWGKVIECKNGWRGEYAYPKELFVPSVFYPIEGPAAIDLTGRDWRGTSLKDIGFGLAAYGVPVRFLETGNPLAELESYASEIRCAE